MPQTINSDELLQEETFEEHIDEPSFEETIDFNIPPKDRKLVTHPYDFIIRSLVDQIEDKTLILKDKFQRRRVWDDTKSSRLIESLLLNVPIPVCYFAELEEGTYSVIDGQQRLTAIYRFLKNEFALKSLKIRPDLIGKRFSQLDLTDKRLITSRTIRCIVILKESNPNIRFDVFERLNSNSVRLNAQELRNSVFRGRLNDLLEELSTNDIFQKSRNVDDIDRRMNDSELVLRFFAFHYNRREYKGLLSNFLDTYLNKGRKMNEHEISLHRELFKRVIADVFAVFGKMSFRRFDQSGKWENRLNRAIYDVIMLSFAEIESQVVKDNSEEILNAFKELCVNDSNFDLAITSGTQAISAINIRLSIWVTVLSDLGIDCPSIIVGTSTER